MLLAQKLVLVVTVWLCAIFIAVDANESPGFFLKVSKNVPRIGRSGARSGDISNGQKSNDADSQSPFSSLFTGLHSDLRLNSKRDSDSIMMDYDKMNGLNYNNIIPYDLNLLSDILSDGMSNVLALKFIAWQDFDEALEHDFELYKKVMQLAKDKDIDTLFDPASISSKNDFYRRGSSTKENPGHYYYRTDRSW